MSLMTDITPDESSASGVDVAICIDHEALMRLRSVIRHLCVGLVDLSVQVRVITSSPEAESLASLGPVQLLVHQKLVWPMRRSAIENVVEALAPHPPSIVYAISSGAYRLGARLAGAFDADFVVQLTTAQDVYALEHYPGRTIAHRIAASEPLLEALVEREGEARDSQTLIRPGVLRGSEISCFGQPHWTPSLVCTTQLEERYGIDVLIEALGIIRDHGHVLLAFFVGTGRAEAALRKSVQSLDLSANVTFARPSAKPVDVLRGADIFVVPPGEEAVSARPLQAMANGTAVVCFEGGVADYFHDGSTAVVCKERTPAALARAIETLLGDHAFAHQLASSAHRYVKEYHPMSAMAEQTVAVFRQLLLQRRPIRLEARD